jgi:hypothetical protein
MLCDALLSQERREKENGFCFLLKNKTVCRNFCSNSELSVRPFKPGVGKRLNKTKVRISNRYGFGLSEETGTRTLIPERLERENFIPANSSEDYSVTNAMRMRSSYKHENYQRSYL